MIEYLLEITQKFKQQNKTSICGDHFDWGSKLKYLIQLIYGDNPITCDTLTADFGEGRTIRYPGGMEVRVGQDIYFYTSTFFFALSCNSQVFLLINWAKFIFYSLGGFFLPCTPAL